MPRITIKVYDNGDTAEYKFDVPMRVTITGKEDHFRRAVEDADMIQRGIDVMLAPDARSWVHSVVMD